MIDLFKINKSEQKTEDLTMHDYLKSGNVHITANNIPVGLVQELIITERRGFSYVQVDISRILDHDNALEKVLAINSDSKLKLEIIEDHGDYEIHFQLNECEVERISRCYNAEKLFTVEDCTLISSSYYKEIKAK